MCDLDLVFINFPTGSEGRDEVAINVTEIASYRSKTVVSYSYEDWTEVVLKNGVTHSVRVKKSDFERKLKEAYGA